MSKVNNNTAENRFRAIVAGFVAFATFGIATWLMLVITGNRDESIPDAVIDKRAELRADNFATLSGEQASLVAPDKVAVAMKSVVGSLAAKPPKASSTPVPGTPAAAAAAPPAPATPPAAAPATPPAAAPATPPAAAP
ncbi:MAG: hypothetical protein KDN04_21815, partial [Verrucomicrobiae bacterium]|nr:hypothetical protein [Verrucomicrobiae bacterium]